MSDDSNVRRIIFAAEHVLGRDVMSMPRQDWLSIVHSDGSPTLLNEAPDPCRGVMHDAMVVAVAASGNVNPDPGFDIARYDPGDAPHIFNIDHYQVVERFQQHGEYQRILGLAGVGDSTGLQTTLDNNVFIIKRDAVETADHWSKQLPERINIARHKATD